MITRTPGVLGGKPCLRRHRVGVHRIAGWWKAGLSVEQIAERLSSLTPADIHVALAYYHLHKEEIEGYLEEERALCQAALASTTMLLKARVPLLLMLNMGILLLFAFGGQWHALTNPANAVL
jgi:uncharacterized protein (DUF433 family)